MDDYEGAYLARKNDVAALPKLHTIAIFHLGGIAVECRLKSLIFLYHQISNWKDKSCRTKDSKFNQPITNPSHDLIKAFKHMPDLYNKAVLDAQFLKSLENIIRPLGPDDSDYIGLRYVPNTTQSQETWQKSFDYVCGWLEKNERTLL